jgi:hypothetical protein
MVSEPRHGLTDIHDLARLGQRRRDDAVDVDLKLRIVELIACEIERALRAFESSLGLVLGSLLVIVVGSRNCGMRLQVCVTRLFGRGIGEIGGCSGELRLRALDLQIKILRIKPRYDVAGMNDIAHIDAARDDLSSDAKAEIGFVPRPHHTDEFASRGLVCEVDPLYLHRTPELGGGGGSSLVAGGEQREDSDDAQGWDNLDEARDPRVHVGLLH